MAQLSIVSSIGYRSETYTVSSSGTLLTCFQFPWYETSDQSTAPGCSESILAEEGSLWRKEPGFTTQEIRFKQERKGVLVRHILSFPVTQKTIKDITCVRGSQL